MITVGSLFSGIGGIDLGLGRAGMNVIWQSEVNPYAAKILAKHWPEVPNLGDITTIDWSTVERPDVICGGFPCQPVSLAGERRGQDDERWLWPEYADALRHLQPDHVVVENVPGLLVRGMGDVLGELAELGYDVEWAGIPAAAVGAPHLRWRVFLVAHAHGGCLLGLSLDGGDGGQVLGEGVQRVVCRSGGGEAALAYTNGSERPLRGQQQSAGGEGAGHVADPERPGLQGRSRRGARRASGVLAPGRQGVGGEWEPEPDVGRVAHGIPSRVDRLRCLGNAVVPQVAELVGRRLAAHIWATECEEFGCHDDGTDHL